MYNSGALALLADYGSDSSEDDVPGPGVSVKRLHETEEYENSKKMKRLPVPNIFLCDNEAMEHVDNPGLHGGRLRTFSHERGNWATYVYVPYEENDGIVDLIDCISKCTAARNIDIKKTDDFHISLTKTVILRHHWISIFVDSLKTNIACFKKFMILFDSFKVYCNEERTRTFIGLQIKTGYDSLLKIVEVLDKCLSEFNLPPFYEDPSFHMSIAWCVGDLEEEIKSLLPEFNHQLHELMDDFSQENWYIYVQYLLCKTGNKYFQFHLT